MPPRGKAFSDAECVAIVKSMIHAKNNPIRGDGQTLDDYHLGFSKQFGKVQLAHWPERPTSALVEKYSGIRRDVHKFMSYLDLVQKEIPKSGTTKSDQQDVEQAMQNFLKKEKKPFLFYSCYPHFRDQPSAGLRKPLPWKPTLPGGAAKTRQMVAPSTPTSPSLELSGDEDNYPWSSNDMIESSENLHNDIEAMFTDFRGELQHQLQNGLQSQQDQHQQHSTFKVGQQQDHRYQQQQQLHQQPSPANSQNQFQSPTNQRQPGQHSQFMGQPQQLLQAIGPHQLFQSPVTQRQPPPKNDPRSQFNSGQQQQQISHQQQNKEPVRIPREVF